MQAFVHLIHPLAVATFAVLLFAAAVHDGIHFTIPNRLSLAVALLYPVHLLTSPAPVDWAGALIAAGATFAVCAILFARGMIGGGDAKLASATMLWAGPPLAFLFLVATALAGGVLSLVVLVRNRLAPRPHPAACSVAGTRIPYGVAIAAGGVIVAGRLLATG